MKKHILLQAKYLAFVSLALFISCNSEKKNKNKFDIQIQNSNSIIYTNAIIVSVIDNENQYDSIRFSIDSSMATFAYSASNSYAIPFIYKSVGTKNATITIFSKTEQEVYTKQITIVSNITPPYKNFTVKNMYNHDNQAYTQGLEFSNGVLYEGTGMRGESTLRKVDLQTGKILKSIQLAANFFGEGITILHNKIYQITWQENTGFVYELESFKQIGTFTYTTEGWGLCNDSTNLIMSDGSEYLYYYNPTTFKLIKKIAVYDNLGPITRLNELEYINGYMYANIYTTDFIVKIEPTTGRVIERYNLLNILPPQFKSENIDVLNGIAWNRETNKLYVTGKNWPKLFEVEFK